MRVYKCGCEDAAVAVSAKKKHNNNNKHSKDTEIVCVVYANYALPSGYFMLI